MAALRVIAVISLVGFLHLMIFHVLGVYFVYRGHPNVIGTFRVASWYEILVVLPSAVAVGLASGFGRWPRVSTRTVVGSVIKFMLLNALASTLIGFVTYWLIRHDYLWVPASEQHSSELRLTVSVWWFAQGCGSLVGALWLSLSLLRHRRHLARHSENQGFHWPPFRRSFSLRSFLIGSIGLALICGLIGMRIRAVERHREALQYLGDANAQVNSQYSTPLSPHVTIWFYSDHRFDSDCRRAIQNVIGLSEFYSGGKAISHEDLRFILDRHRLTVLSLLHSTVSDEDMEVIKNESGLEELDLSFNPITDAGGRHLAAMPNLKKVNLFATSVSGNVANQLRKSGVDVTWWYASGEQLRIIEQQASHGASFTPVGGENPGGISVRLAEHWAGTSDDLQSISTLMPSGLSARGAQIRSLRFGEDKNWQALKQLGIYGSISATLLKDVAMIRGLEKLWLCGDRDAAVQGTPEALQIEGSVFPLVTKLGVGTWRCPNCKRSWTQCRTSQS